MLILVTLEEYIYIPFNFSYDQINANISCIIVYFSHEFNYVKQCTLSFVQKLNLNDYNEWILKNERWKMTIASKIHIEMLDYEIRYNLWFC